VKSCAAFERAFVILSVNGGDPDENYFTLSPSVERAYNEHPRLERKWEIPD
jgi:hypothetical protein